MQIMACTIGVDNLKRLCTSLFQIEFHMGAVVIDRHFTAKIIQLQQEGVCLSVRGISSL